MIQTEKKEAISLTTRGSFVVLSAGTNGSLLQLRAYNWSDIPTDVYGFGVHVRFIDINEFVRLFLERRKFCYIKIY